MKKLLFLLLIVPMISFGQAETAAMTFDKTIHDFGGVMEGDVVMTTFKLIKTTYYSFILNSPLWFDGLQYRSRTKL